MHWWGLGWWGDISFSLKNISSFDWGQEFIIFFNDSLDLFANLLIGNMVLVRNIP